MQQQRVEQQAVRTLGVRSGGPAVGTNLVAEELQARANAARSRSGSASGGGSTSAPSVTAPADVPGWTDFQDKIADMAAELLDSLPPDDGPEPGGYFANGGYFTAAEMAQLAEDAGTSQWLQKLPADFPVDNWDELSAKYQHSLAQKTKLNDQEQWSLLNLRLPLRDMVRYDRDNRARQARQQKLDRAAALGIYPDTSPAEATKLLQNVLKPLYTNLMRSLGLLPPKADPKFLAMCATLYENMQ